MQGKKALLTGITGFIGCNLARKLERERCRIAAIIRPNADLGNLSDFSRSSKTEFLEADLSDRDSLRRQLEGNRWDVIFHVGAVRGGRKVPRRDYFAVNVEATEEIGRYARNTGAKLIFCSSVGVYGAIPRVLPASTDTPFQDDNYYHYTKIEAEKRLQTLAAAGLECVILRPAITYGEGDFGFPYMLVRLIDRGMFVLPDRPVRIHLADVETLCDAFVAAARRSLQTVAVYNVADLEPVELKSLADFIHLELKGATYPEWKRLPIVLYRLGEKMAGLVDNELWKARFELISRSWYYDVRGIEDDLGVIRRPTIPTFRKVVDWYRTLQG